MFLVEGFAPVDPTLQLRKRWFAAPLAEKVLIQIVLVLGPFFVAQGNSLLLAQGASSRESLDLAALRRAHFRPRRRGRPSN